jgi:hypothetical protein
VIVIFLLLAAGLRLRGDLAKSLLELRSDEVVERAHLVSLLLRDWILGVSLLSRPRSSESLFGRSQESLTAA